ncbi:TauD/TfdA family dioxygenase [Verticiella sediminum]|uniref:TauD/TfdA family dioxygenase n=1 Tax=Verticiella sediminum TaxID=1247510 RepID=A0A556AU04_9BURK|nr:TauD/TfdA family dioxygenase [Verticiella sediminum]TSH96422.1 TauD/TfdA family dioxygenase [Verticiella sediminum]
MSTRIEFKPASAYVGAEVCGVDLTAPLGDEELASLRRALGEYGVLVFREQSLTPEQHIAVAESFGNIDVNRFFAAVPGYPMIAEVRKDPGQKSNIGEGWHTDHSYDLAPALGSLLYARTVPTLGGDTLFASMYAAYDALSDGLKHTLDGLQALHSSRHVFGAQRVRDWGDLQGRLMNTGSATQDAVHPVVIRHPISGRKALYVNPDFTVGIDGWSQAESRGLLEFLYQHAARPEFTMRLRWRENTLAFWDNRATWHFALNDYHGQARLMHRITLQGVPLLPGADTGALTVVAAT